MTYCTREDLVAKFGASDIEMLEDGKPAAVMEAIDDATSMINSYLAGRYNLPLIAVPPVLLKVCRDLVRYSLDVDPTDIIIRRRDDAVKYLESLANGRATLGVAQHEEPVGGDTAEMVSAPLRWDRDRSKGFI